MASPNAQRVIDKWKQEPELLIELGLVLTRASVKAKVNLTKDEKAEVFEALGNAIRTRVITGV